MTDMTPTDALAAALRNVSVPYIVEELARAGYTLLPTVELDDRDRAIVALATARVVADYWLREIMGSDQLRATGMSHPVAMVIAALDGETDPRECGLAESAWPAFHAARQRVKA